MDKWVTFFVVLWGVVMLSACSTQNHTRPDTQIQDEVFEEPVEDGNRIVAGEFEVKPLAEERSIKGNQKPPPVSYNQAASDVFFDDEIGEQAEPVIPASEGGLEIVIAKDNAEKNTSKSSEKNLHYKIGVGDNVQIHVWRNNDLSTTVPVRPDGYISMPLLGDIKASTLRPSDLAKNIEERLSVYLRDPRVSVIMLGLSSNEYINRVRITGAVNRPTSIPFREGMTVLDLILDTGGVSQFSAPNRTKIYRKTGDKTAVLKVKLKDILEKADLRTNYDIKPGDVVTVPESLF